MRIKLGSRPKVAVFLKYIYLEAGLRPGLGVKYSRRPGLGPASGGGEWGACRGVGGGIRVGG